MYVCMFMCDVFQFNVYKSKTDIYIYYKNNNLQYVPTTNVSTVHFYVCFYMIQYLKRPCIKLCTLQKRFKISAIEYN